MTTRTMDELAEAMYGKPVLTGGDTPAQPDTSTAQPVADQPATDTPTARTQDEIADAMYAKEPDAPTALDIPADIKAERDADFARSVYSPQVSLADAIPDTIADAPALAHIPEPTRRAAVAELREMAADMGLGPDKVRSLAALDSLFASPPSAEQRAEWRAQSAAQMKQLYGEAADQMLADVRRYVARDPRRVAMLEHNGRGDHPDVVRILVEQARVARLEGRLKPSA